MLDLYKENKSIGIILFSIKFLFLYIILEKHELKCKCSYCSDLFYEKKLSYYFGYGFHSWKVLHLSTKKYNYYLRFCK